MRLCTTIFLSALLGCSSSDASSAPGDADTNDSASTIDTNGADTNVSNDAHDAPPSDSAKDVASDTSPSDPCGVPFTSTGPWCTKLPATTPVDPASSAIVANVIADMKSHFGAFGINTDTYSSPIYTVSATAPTQDWSYTNCLGIGPVPAAYADCWKNVPTTADMVPSKGTDAEITIYSPSLDEEWEFWIANDSGGSWSACWGGCIKNVSKNPGIFPNPIGATACGLPLLGFLVRIDEMQAKKITHAINIAVPRTRKGVFSWPANRTDGNTDDPTILMEGQRMRLDPTFDVSTLPNSAERTLAKAMQDYGMILTDTSGAVDLQAEDPRPWMAAHGTTTDPYDAIWDGRSQYDALKDLPLDRLQVLPKDYGQDFMK